MILLNFLAINSGTLYNLICHCNQLQSDLFVSITQRLKTLKSKHLVTVKHKMKTIQKNTILYTVFYYGKNTILPWTKVFFS